MQANPAEQNAFKTTPIVFGATSGLIEAQDNPELLTQEQPISFHGNFESCMEMYTNAQTVANYLDAHRSWFPQSARPMKAVPIGANGYDLTVGRFGAFGYEVEAKVGLDLLPQNQGVYRIQTIPIPGYQAPGYEVDFQAAMQLTEAGNQGSEPMTHVEWELNLQVTLQFPRFIHAMPRTLIQSTGDRLLNQIVRQVSRCLTYKVQEDFHRAVGVKFPKKRRMLWAKRQDVKLEACE
ncbi:MAG: DUF1997 domain-containing protein [Leptolyngbyaceae cyanobacterium CSU_1_4]|nr:DUF1997 domain-containing protein [Leptolyngbyaceae cyanobacterium CSU_1_4]